MRTNASERNNDVRSVATTSNVLAWLCLTDEPLPLQRLAGTIFGRSRMPLSVVDGALSATLNAQNYNGEVFAAQTNVHPDGLASCDRSAATLTGATCLRAADFAAVGQTSGFNRQRRNQFRGPTTPTSISAYPRQPLSSGRTEGSHLERKPSIC